MFPRLAAASTDVNCVQVVWDKSLGAGIARWWCVELAVLLDAASWVPSSSGEIFSRRGDFSFGVNMASDSIRPPPPPPTKKNNFQM